MPAVIHPLVVGLYQNGWRLKTFLLSCLQPRELPDKWQHDMFEEHAEGRRAPIARPERDVDSSSKLLISNLDFGVSDSDIKVT